MAVIAAHPIMSALVAMEAASQVQQGIAANQQAKYNAQVAEQRAEAARKASEIAKYQIERRKRRMLSRQKALYAKAGVTLEGSPLEVLADTASQFELDKAISNYNYGVEVSRNLSEANFQRYAGKQRRTAGFMNAGTTILGGMSKFKSLSSPAKGSFGYWQSRGLASTPEQYGFSSSLYR